MNKEAETNEVKRGPGRPPVSSIPEKDRCVINLYFNKKDYNLLDNLALLCDFNSTSKKGRVRKICLMMIKLSMEAYFKAMDRSNVQNYIRTVDQFGKPLKDRIAEIEENDITTRDDLRSYTTYGIKNSDVYDEPLHPNEGYGHI